MSPIALDLCLLLHRAHASLRGKLDDELGTLHGLSLDDHALLSLLAQAEGQRLQSAALVRPTGRQLSSVVRQVVTLEKIGLVERRSDEGVRWVVLRPAGRKLWSEASVTAEAVCAAALAGVDGADLAPVAAWLARLCESDALAVG